MTTQLDTAPGKLTPTEGVEVLRLYLTSHSPANITPEQVLTWALAVMENPEDMLAPAWIRSWRNSKAHQRPFMRQGK